MNKIKFILICTLIISSTGYGHCQMGKLLLHDTVPESNYVVFYNHCVETYNDGHGIRQDGNGVFPPAPCNPQINFTNLENKKAYEAAHFPPDLNTRTGIAPGTNCYPYVDT